MPTATLPETKPAETKTPASDTPITPAVAEAVTKDIYSRLRVKPTPPKAKAKDEKPTELEKKVEAAAPEKPAETPAVTTPAKPTAKKKVAAPEPPRVTLDAKALGEAIGKELATVQKPTEAAKDEPKLSPANEKKFSVLKRMAKNNPANASKPDEFIAALKKSEAYQKQWEADNKGKKFNSADEEHAEFIQNNDVSWDEDEYIEALTDLKMDAATQPLKEQQEAQKKEDAARETARQIEPLAIAHEFTSLGILYEEMGGDFKSIRDESGIQNKAEVERLLKSKPALTQMALNAEIKVKEVTGAMYRMAHGTENVNPQNRAHNEAYRFLDEIEAEMKAKSTEDQTQTDKKTGKEQVFATGEEWKAMSPEQRNHYWRYSVEELSVLYAIREADKIKKAADDREKEIETEAIARGYVKPASNGSPAPKEEPKPTPRSPSPTGTIEPRMTTPAKPSGDSGLTIFDRLKGKKVAV